jgi:hypothetical protein
MARGLAFTFLAGVVELGWVIATREPSEPAAVAALLFGVGLVGFALASAALYFVPPQVRRMRRRPRAGPALRRGAIVGTAIASLAFLRALDALSAVTAVFVLAAFAALEGVLSARS